MLKMNVAANAMARGFFVGDLPAVHLTVRTAEATAAIRHMKGSEMSILPPRLLIQHRFRLVELVVLLGGGGGRPLLAATGEGKR